MKKIITTVATIMVITTLSVTQTNAQNIVKTMTSGNWTDPNIWNGGTVPTANDKVLIVDSTQVVIDFDIVSCDGISIGTGASLSAYNNGTINVTGDWDNLGTFVDNYSTVNFNGNTGHAIGGKPTIFNNMTINDPSGVWLLADASLKGELQLNNGKLMTKGFDFTLISDANNTARIAPVNMAASGIAGDITVERFINNLQGDWRFIGSAVIGDSIRDLNNSFPTYGYVGATYPGAFFTSILNYDESVAGTSDIGFNYTLDASQILRNGSGYKCWIDSGSYTLRVKGLPAIGDQTFNITNTPTGNPGDDGWNLLANPYASSIDWNSTEWTKLGITDGIYVWNPELQQYASYMGGVSTNGGSNIITSSQAFWVQATGNNPSLSCTENVKVADNRKFMKTIAPTSTLTTIKFGLSGQGYSDETVINFSPNAISGYDKKEDLIKLFGSNSKAPSLSTIADNKYDLAINSVPSTVLNQDISIRVKVGVPGTYTIKPVINMFVKLFSNMILEDLVTKTKIDITTNPFYTFNVSDTVKATRFVLHLSTPVKIIPTTLKTFAVEPTCSYKKNGKAVVKVNKSGSWNYTWRAVNGNTLAVHTSNFDTDTLNDVAAGKYTVEVTEITNTPVRVKPVSASVEVSVNAMEVSSKINHNEGKSINNGSIEAAVVRGGNGPYKFNWSNKEVSTNIKNLSSGTYTLYTIDAKGCVDTSYHVVNADQLVNANNERGIQIDPKNTDNAGKIKFIVYPNPNSGEFTVDISGLENSHDVTITLKDQKGMNVYESMFNVQDESSIQRKIVPESKLLNGVYFCTLSTEGIKQTVKVIVN